ncbi:DUF445 domain-containing protein [Agromyces larvae]|uniref:DUF445 domain-containing protein n=1 Tax=Agromyces larvae TaxID=2929802 RepID=A0ABY4BWX0_9MICO|nr:DUF445 domain-containing protein [Agromyces larvae]UOE43700.1 DUF445 domain-containing protein [Agromyces larvae]
MTDASRLAAQREDASDATTDAPRLTDAARRIALRRMKALATWLLVAAAVVFAIAFALQDAYPWLGYVRAAAEGAMVGALADWFAVTALFRHPLGLPIPHTAIIPTRKDEIGRTLGDFVELEFLSDEVVLGKLRSIGLARRLGEWLRVPANAERLTGEAAAAARAVLRLLADDDVERVIDQLARRHLFAPEWGPAIGRVGAQLVAADQQRHALDAIAEQAEAWLAAHPEAFGAMVSSRLPKWVPSVVDRFVDERAHREVLGFARAVRDDPQHPARLAIDAWLAEFAERLQHDPALIARVEALKLDLLDSPRVREFAAEAWSTVRTTLESSLEDPGSELRAGLRDAVAEIGGRLATDAALQAKVDDWATDAAAHLVRTYRHDLAGVIAETVERWDPAEASAKLELQVGRDLQFIRINGTVVGALAGLAIFTVATLVHALF